MMELKWYIKWDDDIEGWGVWLGKFRDSWHRSKYRAGNRRDILNDMEQELEEE